MLNKSKVSLVKSSAHYPGVLKSLRILEPSIKTIIASLPAIVIKINLVITRTPRYSTGVELATTPLDAVRSFIDFILPFYAGKIIIAEEAAWGDTKDGFEFYGFTRLAQNHSQIELLELRDDEMVIKKITCPGGELDVPLSKTLLEAPFLVSITRPKTHCTVVMTGAIKNVLVGAIHKYSNRRKIHRGNGIHYFLNSLAEHTYPDLVVLDGTIGMQGGGPVKGTEINSDWVISSFDALAADSLALHLMGFEISDVGYLSLLSQQGFGSCFPNSKIEIVSEKPQDCFMPYQPHRNHKKMRDWKMDVSSLIKEI